MMLLLTGVGIYGSTLESTIIIPSSEALFLTLYITNSIHFGLFISILHSYTLTVPVNPQESLHFAEAGIFASIRDSGQLPYIRISPLVRISYPSIQFDAH